MQLISSQNTTHRSFVWHLPNICHSLTALSAERPASMQQGAHCCPPINAVTILLCRLLSLIPGRFRWPESGPLARRRAAGSRRAALCTEYTRRPVPCACVHRQWRVNGAGRQRPALQGLAFRHTRRPVRLTVRHTRRPARPSIAVLSAPPACTLRRLPRPPVVWPERRVHSAGSVAAHNDRWCETDTWT